jgi:PIN domain nuclease of toxin-antitoxin system
VKAPPELAVVDTHALIWWIADARGRLGRGAAAFFARVDAGEAVACVPTMALVEMAEAVQSGRLVLSESFGAFVERLELTPSRYRVVPLTAAIVLRSYELFAIPERGDRLVAATAAHLDCPVVTRDPAIAAAGGCEWVW